MGYVTDKVFVNGIEMEYLKFGRGQSNLVILPGLSVRSVIPHAAAIVKQYDVFTDEYTVYLFDRRINIPPVYSISDMAKDTVQVMKKLDICDVSLFGTSQGGMIAMAAALEYPELVRKLVLVSTTIHAAENRCSVIKKWITFAENKDREGLLLNIAEDVYSKEFFIRYREAFCALAKTVTDDELERFIIIAKGIEGFDIRDEVHKIKCPVLIASDDKDCIFDAAAAAEMRQYFAANKKTETKIYSGFGHALYDTAPDFTELMYNFLKK